MTRLVLALAIIGAVAGSIAVTGRPHVTPFVSEPLPQRATGDFDGDGTLDVARIDRSDTLRSGIAVSLSGSDGGDQLHGRLSAIIGDDIDHDGDVDLLATTESGEVLVWLNDGHGRFTEQPRSESRSMAGEPVIAYAGAHDVLAVGAPVYAFDRSEQSSPATVVTRIRPPTFARAASLHLLLLRSLRAPPAIL